MTDREKVIKWLEYDYFPRVGAYRKDCKQGCDACMPKHDGDDYCDIDMLCKVLAILKEQKRKKGSWDYGTQCSVCKGTIIPPKDRKIRVNFCPWCGADMRDSYEQ